MKILASPNRTYKHTDQNRAAAADQDGGQPPIRHVEYDVVSVPRHRYQTKRENEYQKPVVISRLYLWKESTKRRRSSCKLIDLISH